MRLRRVPTWFLAAIFTSVLSASGAAQDSAPPEKENPPPEEVDVEVASPMVLEVELPAKFGSLSPRPGTAYQKEFTEMRRFVCDKTRVDKLKVSRTTDKKGRAVVTFEPTFLYRRDFRLKLEVIAGSETLLAKEVPFAAPRAAPGAGFALALAPALVGLGASYTLSTSAKLTIEEEKWKAAFSDDSGPVVRLTLTAKQSKKSRKNVDKVPPEAPTTTPPPSKGDEKSPDLNLLGTAFCRCGPGKILRDLTLDSQKARVCSSRHASITPPRARVVGTHGFDRNSDYKKTKGEGQLCVPQAL